MLPVEKFPFPIRFRLRGRLHVCCGPGVNVMITIFGDFFTISGEKKLAFLSKTNVVIKFLNNLALF
jgi:hypothetical protein